MWDEIDQDLIRRGWERYDELLPKLIEDYRGDAILIDCKSGQYVIQGKNEPRYAAEARLLETSPDAAVLMDYIADDTFAYAMPTTTAG